MKKCMKQGPGRDGQDIYRSRYILTFGSALEEVGGRMLSVSTCVFSTLYTHRMQCKHSPLASASSPFPTPGPARPSTSSHHHPPASEQGKAKGKASPYFDFPLWKVPATGQSSDRGALGIKPRLRHSRSRLTYHRLRLRRLPGRPASRPASPTNAGLLPPSLPRTSCNNPRALRMPCLLTSGYQAIPDSSRYLITLSGIKGGGESLLIFLRRGTLTPPMSLLHFAFE